MSIHRLNRSENGQVRVRYQQTLLAGFLLVVVSLMGEGLLTANESLSESEEITTKVTVSTKSVQVAEPFQAEIRITAPAGAKVSFPQLGNAWGAFDVLEYKDQFDVPAVDGSGMRSWFRRLTLETISTGDLELPSLEIQVRTGASNAASVVRTDAQKIQVMSVLESQSDPLQFRDIKGVVNLEIPEPASYAWAWWLAGGIGGALMLGVAALVLAKKRQWNSPRQWAQKEIQQLRETDAFSHGEMDFCVDRMDQILRSFLEWEFAIPAANWTPREILSSLEQQLHNSERSALQCLASWFDRAEQAKFAGAVSCFGNLQQSTVDLQRLVEHLESDHLSNDVTDVLSSAEGEL